MINTHTSASIHTLCTTTVIPDVHSSYRFHTYLYSTLFCSQRHLGGVFFRFIREINASYITHHHATPHLSSTSLSLNHHRPLTRPEWAVAQTPKVSQLFPSASSTSYILLFASAITISTHPMPWYIQTWIHLQVACFIHAFSVYLSPAQCAQIKCTKDVTYQKKKLNKWQQKNHVVTTSGTFFFSCCWPGDVEFWSHLYC